VQRMGRQWATLGALSQVLLFQQRRRHAQTFYLTITSADCFWQRVHAYAFFKK
jgi:hypothetical protein